MSREWKPGDVAMVTTEHTGTVRRLLVDSVKGLRWWGPDGFVGDENVLAARPLVVIDPEDREQAERLLRAWYVVEPERDVSMRLDRMQTALREFANPTPPKPEEPTGRHAIVADEDGSSWIRRDRDWCLFSAGPNPDKPGLGATRGWDGVPAVRVLSEGVQP